jgi:Domain of unknown function (DUF4345)
MSPRSTKRRLQVIFWALGIVPILTGLFAVLTGPGGQVDGEAVNASVDSEFRFFASLWIAYGVAALWVAPRVEREATAVRVLALILFSAGVARGIGWIAAGRPHWSYLVLLGLELLIPPLILRWHGQLLRMRRAQEAGVSGT